MNLSKSFAQASALYFQGKAFLNHCFKAKTRYSIHSPFLYDWVSNVLRANGDPQLETKAEYYRGSLLQDHEPLFKSQQGAKSKRLVPERKSVSQEAAKSGIARKHGRLLMRLTAYYRLSNVLELGTSLGIGTTYLALGQQSLNQKQLVSIEGSSTTYEKAASHFNHFRKDNPEFDHVQLCQGRFDACLPEVLNTLGQVDLLFLDGDHRYEAVMENFSLCLAKAASHSVFVIDDIHWSPGMEKAWQTIQETPEVTLTIDLFQMGLAFLNPNLTKEHWALWY